MTASEEWIRVLDAATFLARRFGGLTYAKEAISLGLREGLLQARADYLTFCDPDYEEKGEEGAVFECEATDDEPIDVPPEIWSRSANWDRDRSGWDWANGEFEIEGHSSERLEYSYGGLSLLQSEVDGIASNVAPYDEICRRNKKTREKVEARRERTSSPKYWNWEPALAELIAVTYHDGLDNNPDFPDLFRRGGSANLETWFAKWFERNHKPSDSSPDRTAPSVPECRIRARYVLSAIRGYTTKV